MYNITECHTLTTLKTQKLETDFVYTQSYFKEGGIGFLKFRG